MTVLKTMFTGIVVTCLLIFLTSALGLLDFTKIFVNQTYLWPGIVGGLIMGVGFIVGGYCPGTSVVSAASFKIDGIVFFLGTLLGAGLFGETVDFFDTFWNSSYYDRYLLSDWLKWSIGAVVLAVTLMALVMFWGAEKIEQLLGRTPVLSSIRRWYRIGALCLISVATVIFLIGQPSPEKRWQLMGAQYESQLNTRDIFIHPLEWAKTWNDSTIKLVTLDLRSREAFNAFHLNGAENVELSQLSDPHYSANLARLPANGVVILVADDEAMAVIAWKWLKVQGTTNLFIIENGLKDWQQLFQNHSGLHSLDLTKPSTEALETFPKDFYTPKIKLHTVKRGGGLCS